MPSHSHVSNQRKVRTLVESATWAWWGFSHAQLFYPRRAATRVESSEYSKPTYFSRCALSILVPFNSTSSLAIKFRSMSFCHILGVPKRCSSRIFMAEMELTEPDKRKYN